MIGAARPGARIGTGKQAEVFADGAAVTKLYNAGIGKQAAFREAANLALVEVLGLPAPRVHAVRRHSGRWGLTMSRAPAGTFAEAMRGAPAEAGAWLAAMVALQRAIHDQPGTGLPALKARIAAAIARAPHLGADQRRALLGRLETLPDGDRLCHGDYHPFNVMGTPQDAMVVDWMDAAMGAPAADLCRSWLLERMVAPALAEAHVSAYCATAGLAPGAVAAWRPVLAAARLAEDVPEEVPELLALVAAG